MVAVVIVVLFFAWAFTGALFMMLGLPDVLAAILGLAGPVGLIWLCAHSYDPFEDVIQRGHENFKQMERDRIARWTKEAQWWDCWYQGSSIVAPQTDYGSDGSIKRDRWTGLKYPKGAYFLDSQGYNATGVVIPPNAKRCPD